MGENSEEKNESFCADKAICYRFEFGLMAIMKEMYLCSNMISIDDMTQVQIENDENKSEQNKKSQKKSNKSKQSVNKNKKKGKSKNNKNKSKQQQKTKKNKNKSKQSQNENKTILNGMYLIDFNEQTKCLLTTKQINSHKDKFKGLSPLSSEKIGCQIE